MDILKEIFRPRRIISLDIYKRNSIINSLVALLLIIPLSACTSEKAENYDPAIRALIQSMIEEMRNFDLMHDANPKDIPHVCLSVTQKAIDFIVSNRNDLNRISVYGVDEPLVGGDLNEIMISYTIDTIVPLETKEVRVRIRDGGACYAKVYYLSAMWVKIWKSRNNYCWV